MRDYCCHLSPPLEPGLLTASPSEHISRQASALPRAPLHLIDGVGVGLTHFPSPRGRLFRRRGASCPPSSPANLGAAHPHSPNNPAGTTDEKTEAQGLVQGHSALTRQNWKSSPDLLAVFRLLWSVLKLTLKDAAQRGGGRGPGSRPSPSILQQPGYTGTSLYLSEPFIIVY